MGIGALLAIAFFLLGLISDLLIPLIIAAILAGIFVPLVDRLERWRLPRWLGAPLVVVLVIVVVSLIAWSVAAGLLRRDREILARVITGLNEGGSLAGITAPDTEQALMTPEQTAFSAASAAGGAVGTVTSTGRGCVLG